MNNKSNVFIEPPKQKLQEAYRILFNDEVKLFLYELYTKFEDNINELYKQRALRKTETNSGTYNLKFRNNTQAADLNWRVAPVPSRLKNRRLDLGDVSPTSIQHFTSALNAEVQGIQVDFDDGHCPTWNNQILGLLNVYKAIHNQLPNVPTISKAPILMLRPRAWNMIENHVWINNKPIPGPILDFAILMFHNAKILVENECGPFFYLSKMEGSNEAQLWNNIFIWAQRKLNIPHGTIKACVLIENILSSFEMNEILYELRDHSLGLNCGIWDYAASVISKFGHYPNYCLPDRNKYVNMNRHFLKRYLQLVVRTCHFRGAHATGGMYAQILPDVGNQIETFYAVQKALKAKHTEILEGIDGFMVYDIRLVPYMNEMWNTESGSNPNQISQKPSFLKITEDDLLRMPDGGVTMDGLEHNIRVGVLFILNWLGGVGHFIYLGSVEDSATAEISRSQVWQWIKHNSAIEEMNQTVTLSLVTKLTYDFLAIKEAEETCKVYQKRVKDAVSIFLEIVSMNEFPEFITSYLNEHPIYITYHDTGVSTIKHKL